MRDRLCLPGYVLLALVVTGCAFVQKPKDSAELKRREDSRRNWLIYQRERGQYSGLKRLAPLFTHRWDSRTRKREWLVWPLLCRFERGPHKKGRDNFPLFYSSWEGRDWWIRDVHLLPLPLGTPPNDRDAPRYLAGPVPLALRKDKRRKIVCLNVLPSAYLAPLTFPTVLCPFLYLRHETGGIVSVLGVGRARKRGMSAFWFLLPMYGHYREQRTHGESHSFLMGPMYGKSTTAISSRFRRETGGLFPLFHKSSGKQSPSTFSLLGVLWRSYVTPDVRKHSLLWPLMQYSRTPDEARLSLFGIEKELGAFESGVQPRASMPVPRIDGHLTQHEWSGAATMVSDKGIAISAANDRENLYLLVEAFAMTCRGGETPGGHGLRLRFDTDGDLKEDLLLEHGSDGLCVRASWGATPASFARHLYYEISVPLERVIEHRNGVSVRFSVDVYSSRSRFYEARPGYQFFFEHVVRDRPRVDE